MQKDDVIYRQDALRALWKALYEYEDKTKKQFLESDELDIDDWIQHRIFVQNMSDIDRQIIIDLPPAQQEQRWIPCEERLPEKEVLCCDVRGEMIIGYPYKDIESNTGFSAELDDVYLIDCIAWMPLPEPHRGEEK